MDQPKDTAATGTSASSETPKIPEISAVLGSHLPEAPNLKSGTGELPSVESPSISPVDLVKTADSDLEPAAQPIPELSVDAPPPADDIPALDRGLYVTLPKLALRPRHKRYALLAASVAIAAVCGGVIGALATGNSAPPVNTAAIEESKAMQVSVAKLAKEVTTLRANLDEANKTSRAQTAQVAKLEAKLDTKIDSKIAKLDERLKKDAAEETTGSISAPQTTAPAASQTAAVPTPPPRPQQAQRLAAAPSTLTPPASAPALAPPPAAPARLAIVPGWSIRDARGGYLYVESRGEIYQVSPGAPLPGLGQVESIKRLDGRWVVKTPRGIIVSMRDRRYFE